MVTSVTARASTRRLRLLLLPFGVVLLPCVVVRSAIRLLVLALVVIAKVVPQAGTPFAAALSLRL
jgi:hypothetical protein